jgi:hypothetical protein
MTQRRNPAASPPRGFAFLTLDYNIDLPTSRVRGLPLPRVCLAVVSKQVVHSDPGGLACDAGVWSGEIWRVVG